MFFGRSDEAIFMIFGNLNKEWSNKMLLKFNLKRFFFSIQQHFISYNFTRKGKITKIVEN